MAADRSFSALCFSAFALCWAAAATCALADESTKVDIGSLKVLDAKGEKYSLDANARRLGTVFVFLSAECPISRQYIPELNRLQQVDVLASGKVAFYGVLSDPSVTRRAAVNFANEFKIGFPVLFDASGELAGLFRPDVVPEAFLVNAAGVIVYRERIDDLYPEIGKRRAAPTSRDLLDALTALAEKRALPNQRTLAVGCPFEGRTTVKETAKVTYTREIAPILFAHCVELLGCHCIGSGATELILPGGSPALGAFQRENRFFFEKRPERQSLFNSHRQRREFNSSIRVRGFGLARDARSRPSFPNRNRGS